MNFAYQPSGVTAAPTPLVNPKNIRVLVVEDEYLVAEDIQGSLIELGYQVVATAATGAEAIECTTEFDPTVVIMDIRLKGNMDGIQAAEHIWQQARIPIIFLTANSDEETLARALRIGPKSYLIKPFRIPDLRCAIEISLHQHSLAVQLHEREQWLLTTLRSIGEAVVTTDPNQKISFMNPVAEQITGWSNEAALGKLFDSVVQLIKSNSGEPLSSPLHRALANKTAVDSEFDAVLVDRQGEITQVDNNAAPIINRSGEVLGGVVVLRDVTEQRRIQQEIGQLNAQLEKRVAERTAQLQAANKELEAFSYSVAHDLRAPLRTIDGFAQILIEDQAAALDETAVNHLERIRLAAERMGKIIDALLRLALIPRHEFKKEHVDLAAMVREIVSEMQRANPQRQIRWNIAPQQLVFGDRELLRMAVENLLSNAYKFTKSVENPTVDVKFDVRDGITTCSVADNGIGFDMRFANKLFGVFQRLHPQDQYEGTGIGLALVERIIHRHGGNVSAQGEIGKGATISFSL